MKRMLVSLAVMLAAWGWSSTTTAQPPDGEFEPPPRREGPPGGRRPPPDPLREALDANHDHELDADEIKNAAAALALLDEDGDGRISERELMPPPPRGFEGRLPRDRRGPDGAAPSEADGRGPRERPGFRPPEGGERPSPERFVTRAMSFDADGDGKLDRGELEKLAGEMMSRMRGGPEAGRRGPPPPRGEEGVDGEPGPSRRPRRPPAATEEGGDQPE